MKKLMLIVLVVMLSGCGQKQVVDTLDFATDVFIYDMFSEGM